MLGINAGDVQAAVHKIISYLEQDPSNNSRRAIYFSGWQGLGASAVLRAIAEHPPPSLREKFDKIIHIDCSRWKSRRALQRVIANELNLTQQVADIDKQDEEDDYFHWVDQGSRAEIRGVTTMIARYLAPYRCLVVFHNGSDSMIDLTSFGIPQPEVFRTMVLWTFRGRLRLRKTFSLKDNDLDLLLHSVTVDQYHINFNAILAEEAREIALYAQKLGIGVAPEVAMECCLYLLSLNHRGGDLIDYKWAIHACSYWVCDGILGSGQGNQAWEFAHALQQHIRLDLYSSNKEPTYLGNKLDVSTKHWVPLTGSKLSEVPPGTTSLFFAPRLQTGYVSLPNDGFYGADQLRVLKLCRCTFNFSSPPFHCCHNLRFLGLEGCMDEQKLGEEKQTDATAVETFQRLWVLDVCRTDWELDFPPETGEPAVLSTDIREVHINKGRIWSSNLAWRRLPNLRKLRVVEPTSSWETGRKDEFDGMMKLELLDLSWNNTIQVLPSLSGATGLKTLVLDTCHGLEHVGPQGIPPSLESFSLDARKYIDHRKNVKISSISLAGCAMLTDFNLRGSVTNLKELDLSHTAVKMLDLREAKVGSYLERVLLMGCEQLYSILWPEMYRLRLLCIGPRADLRFLASLWRMFRKTIIWVPEMKMHLCFSSRRRSCHQEKQMGRPYSTGQLAACPPLPKASDYHDVSSIATKILVADCNNSSHATQLEPLGLHMEIGEGISEVSEEASAGGRPRIRIMMNVVKSLHVHDCSTISNVAPDHIFFFLRTEYDEVMNGLRWCHVERCPRLATVFATNYYSKCFSDLETFWAAHLLMARSIWSRPTRPMLDPKYSSFTQLRVIQLHFCPRVCYVLPMSSNNALSEVLETLHIHRCGDLKQVFPVEQEFLEKIAASHERGMLAFPKLKNLYLRDLSSLQLICEAKMFAPNLGTIYVRGCWGLRRLPATDSSRREDDRPVAVDCEKDWWDKLEWDGMESGHHPSLFQPRHCKYYKKRHLRRTVLR